MLVMVQKNVIIVLKWAFNYLYCIYVPNEPVMIKIRCDNDNDNDNDTDMYNYIMLYGIICTGS